MDYIVAVSMDRLRFRGSADANEICLRIRRGPLGVAAGFIELPIRSGADRLTVIVPLAAQIANSLSFPTTANAATQ
jgi:hypothetical protein